MNSALQKLQPYPFERLRALTAGNNPPPTRPPISLALGEPRHAPPLSIRDALRDVITGLGAYPTTAGSMELRETCARWLETRFGLGTGAVDAQRMVLPVSGTREGLFSIAQAVVERQSDAAVLMPNPFYQIYEGAALLADAQPVYLDAIESNDFLPDLDAVDAQTWQRCQLFYACTPGNPTGAVAPRAWLEQLIELSARHDFVIASDECYSEIYLDEDEPPAGLLQACAALGNDRFERCLVFHSLSKTASLPGLRSGFVAGDARIIERFALYRTYLGTAMPLHHQRISIAAWRDTGYARANRARYRAKFAVAGRRIADALAFSTPAGAFYIWARTPVDDEQFARELHARENVLVLPGRYLARASARGNPGAGRVRISLVGTEAESEEAAERIVRYVSSI